MNTIILSIASIASSYIAMTSLPQKRNDTYGTFYFAITVSLLCLVVAGFNYN
jgi:hypothetical protein